MDNIKVMKSTPEGIMPMGVNTKVGKVVRMINPILSNKCWLIRLLPVTCLRQFISNR